MNFLKYYVSLTLFAIIALVALYGRYGVTPADGTAVAQIEPAAGEEEKPYDIGGAFSLTDHDGQSVTDQDFLGSYKLLFFGFSNCPDVCPAGLQKIARALELLGDKEKEVQPLFITVDPARDTPEVLKEYTALYHPRLIGLTGDEAQIEGAVAAYKAYASKEEGPDAHDHHYMMNHSAFIYLLDPENRVLDFFSAHDSAEDMAAAIAPRLSGS